MIIYGNIFQDDDLEGTNSSDFIYGLSGNDTINALGGNDYADGGSGNDTIQGGSGGDELVGGLDNDILTARSFSVWADTDFDRLFGGFGDDIIYGGSGDDLYGGPGIDVLHLDLSTALSGVVLDTEPMTRGISTLLGGILTTVFEVLNINGGNLGEFEIIESVVGTNFDDEIRIVNRQNVATMIDGGDGNDILTSLGGNDTLIGGLGNDKLYSNHGNDILIGGAGDDRLYGGGGTDEMQGGTGNDHYRVNNAPDIVTELADEGTDWVHATVDWTLGANVENLKLLGRATNGTGNELDNRILGHSKAETFYGLDGDDVIYGLEGRDILFGGSGNDTLVGGQGVDQVTGGAGRDHFRFDDLSDMSAVLIFADIVHDFTIGEDRLNFRFMDADTTNVGVEEDDNFSWIGTDAFSNTAGELRYEHINGDTYVSGDVNGDGASDFLVRLIGEMDLAANCVVL